MIAIIAILAAMLLPALQKARARAQTSACSSNLRQMMLGNNLYSSDSKQYYISYEGDGGWAWRLKTLGYIGSHRCYICPAARNVLAYKTSSTDRIFTMPENSIGYSYISYGYNYQNMGGSYNEMGSSAPWVYFPAQIGMMRYPAKKVWFADARSRSDRDYGCNILAQNVDGATVGNIFDVHLDSANILWADGHLGNIRNARNRLQCYNAGLLPSVGVYFRRNSNPPNIQ